ncbi:MAG: hypothetical protein AB8B79_15665 [Granulosicoccus sp.]
MSYTSILRDRIISQLATSILVGFSCFTFANAQTGTVSIEADIWADNWFAMYIGERQIVEDSVSITTERSFNAESFTFDLEPPGLISFVIKDFKENDTGLEYIGTRKQQMGDGGFIAQFRNASTGATVLVSNSDWQCLPIHIAPLNKQCEKSENPANSCEYELQPEPTGWRDDSFDTSEWPQAIEYSERSVRPKDGYDKIDWHNDAQLIWTSDIESDNTILCQTTLEID